MLYALLLYPAAKPRNSCCSPWWAVLHIIASTLHLVHVSTHGCQVCCSVHRNVNRCKQKCNMPKHSRAGSLLLDELGHAVSEALGKAGASLHSNLQQQTTAAAAAARLINIRAEHSTVCSPSTSAALACLLHILPLSTSIQHRHDYNLSCSYTL